MHKIGIIGSSGKLGQLLSQHMNSDVYSVVLTANSTYWEEKQVPEIVVNISSPIAVEEVINYCARKHVALIEGTSGLTAHHLSLLKELALTVPVVHAENFSVLHFLQYQLVNYLIQQIPDKIDFQLSVNERHTLSKKDAPSATARKLARLCKSKGIENVNINYTRCGLPVSDHEIRMTTENEELIIRHGVQNRAAAVEGIIKAIHWISHQQSGYWTMEDVYTEKNYSIGASS